MEQKEIVVKVRDAVLADEEWIKAAFKSHRDLAGAFYWSWRGFWERPDPQHKWLVAMREGDLVGTVHYKVSKRFKAWYLMELFVQEDFRKHGIGALLLRKRPDPAILKTNSDNSSAQLFYEEHGFKKDSESRTKAGRLLYIYRRGE